MSYEQVIIGFLSSPEFFARQGGTSIGFVQGLYQKLLGRTGGAAEAAGWVQALGSGLSSAQVIGGFLSSREFALRSVDLLYRDYLGRPAASDPGSQGWVALLLDREGQNARDGQFMHSALKHVQLAILASTEFTTVVNDLSHTAYFVVE